MPAAVALSDDLDVERGMAAVMIGVDPHKASHTAVAVSAAEEELGRLRVRAGAGQAGELVAWAAAWPERAWAVEGAGGLGYLLARQLAAAGERVLDVQPRLAARVRLLAAGNPGKSDPNDARSAAVAALRPAAAQPVRAGDHAEVLRLRAKRHKDLGRARSQAACRLHALLCELVPGGHPRRDITAAAAARLLEQAVPAGPAAAARHELAAELIEDLRGLDARIRESRQKITAAVTASGASLTQIFGVGPVVAATVIGGTAGVDRFPSRGHFAACNGTAPVEASSGSKTVYRLSRRGNRRLNHAIHMAALTQIRHRHTEGRAYYDRKLAEGKTPKEALRALKRRISDALYARLKADARPAATSTAGPGGQPGNDCVACAAGSHPEHRLFGQATPGPASSLRPPQPVIRNKTPQAT